MVTCNAVALVEHCVQDAMLPALSVRLTTPLSIPAFVTEALVSVSVATAVSGVCAVLWALIDLE